MNLKPKSKRQDRREKQRLENPVRAAAMHKARLESESIFVCKSGTVPHYNIGCSGWFYWHWRDCFYNGVPNSKWFDHYAYHFKTVELNASFYSWPTIATIKSWARQAKGRPFVYTVKVSELITHTKKFAGTKNLIKDFGYIADLLGPQMGCLLFQLPPSYHYTPARLRTILSQLELGRRNVMEFRHASWWNQKVYDAFKKAGVIFCSCSAPKLPDELIKTADDVYIRFHGTQKWYRHDYSREELNVWAKRIRDSKAKHVWVYFNNDYDCHAIKNARELMRLLKVN